MGADGERVARVRLRALPDRTIVVRSARVGGVCTATATATVGATAASLSNVHARLRWLFGVASLTLTGRVPESGAVVEETLEG